MIKWRAFFFDMDGVLYDSMPNHEYTWTKTFEAEEILLDPREAYINEGRTGRGMINLIFNRNFGRDASEDEIERIYSRKTRLMRECPVAPLMPRMKQLVDYLRLHGIAAYVVTGSKQPSLIDKLWREYGFDKEHIVCGADVKRGKPDPEPYQIALQRSGCRPQECVVVENAPLGVRAAKAAGLYCIAVNTGKLDNSYLTEEHCDELYASTTELTVRIIGLLNDNLASDFTER
ncbi:MAG: HAD family phosphatase [Bacteroidales bacterium]|nr:HAD family phosphatase [Bacteroidales bacterium]